MTQLCENALERPRASEGQYDEYIYYWVDTLQTYWLRRTSYAKTRKGSVPPWWRR
ncbi:immunity 49 family protein [Streptomyces sp. 769]|uniref:immunity 49 family protein n=1 Tax=Streptomyces sp. 769 TaxID=1262452 RepID=UPI001EEF8383|nr:immunity 49 family protein [Streptomyces sp. 769]